MIDMIMNIVVYIFLATRQLKVFSFCVHYDKLFVFFHTFDIQVFSLELDKNHLHTESHNFLKNLVNDNCTTAYSVKK